MTRDEAFARLLEIKSLPANWDSEGAIPVGDVAFTKAYELLHVMTEHFGFSPPTSVSPTRVGAVTFLWRKSIPGVEQFSFPAYESLLEIGVRPDGSKWVAQYCHEPLPKPKEPE